MKFWLLVLASLCTLSLYLLALSSGNTSALASWYWQIFALNSILFIGLVSIIVRQAWMLRQEFRLRLFGSRLTLRLVSMFALVAVLPGVLLFTVSVLFLNRSIESWFNVRVETALESGLNLGRSSFDALLLELEKKGEHAQKHLETQSISLTNMVKTLNHLRTQLGIEALSLFDKNGQHIAFVGNPNTPTRTFPSDLMQSQRSPNALYRAIEPLETQHLLRVIFSVQPLGWRDVYFLQLQHQTPLKMSEHAQHIETAYSAYQQLALTRQGLKEFYLLTLSLTLLLSLSGALILGMYLSRRLSAPLAELAAGTRAIAQGDFSHQNRVHRRDELGMLGALFNRMTRQLSEAKKTSEAARAETEAERLFLESILSSLSSGVLAFDHHAKLRSKNPSAEKILGEVLTKIHELPLETWTDHAPKLASLIAILEHHAHNAPPFSSQKEIVYQSEQGERLLLTRGIKLPDHAGFIIIFDDITELAHAQRAAAWGEVAKRLAHEIRNPLTPIQLAAERLQMKLMDKLSETDADMLQRNTNTIVAQVDALKKMVDAFRDYARAPDLEFEHVDIHALLHDILTLYESQSRLNIKMTAGKLMIWADQNRLRQVLHNLLKNAQEATLPNETPQLTIQTERQAKHCKITIRDSGCGFPEDILPRAFEPYISNKQKGTGLGLAVVKKIIEEHHGSIHLSNHEQGGAEIVLTLPLMETVCEAATS